jgi:hypothetical protein
LGVHINSPSKNEYPVHKEDKTDFSDIKSRRYLRFLNYKTEPSIFVTLGFPLSIKHKAFHLPVLSFQAHRRLPSHDIRPALWT